MKPKTLSLWEVDAYFERHNLVIRPKSFGWRRDEETGLMKPHVEATRADGSKETKAD